jgi:hypothetical protein
MLLLGTHDEVMETIPHELTHMVVEQATWNPYGGIPTWLNEGLASYAELNGEPPPGRQEDLEQAIKDDRLLSIRSLSAEPGDPDQVNLFYAESFSLVKFLLDQYGKDKMSQFLATFKEGSLPEDALKKVYGFGIDELEAKWRESLGLKPRMAITVTAVPKATTPAISATPTVVPPTPTKVPSGGLCSGAVVGLLAIGYVIWRRQPLARG